MQRKARMPSSLGGYTKTDRRVLPTVGQRETPRRGEEPSEEQTEPSRAAKRSWSLAHLPVGPPPRRSAPDTAFVTVKKTK